MKKDVENPLFLCQTETLQGLRGGQHTCTKIPRHRLLSTDFFWQRFCFTSRKMAELEEEAKRDLKVSGMIY